MRVSLVLALVAAALVVVQPGGAVAAESPSDGCDTVNSPLFDNVTTAGLLSGQPFIAGEIVTMDAASPAVSGTPNDVTLIVNGNVVDQANYPGSVSYEIPTDGPYVMTWTVGTGTVQWDVSCTPLPNNADVDGDGVLNDADICPDTDLPDTPTAGLKGAHLAAQTDGTFDSGVDKFDGLFTLTDTGGCAGAQIIELLDLGKGHVKFGISKGALVDFIAELS